MLMFQGNVRIHAAAHDEPNDQFRPFGAKYFDIVFAGHAGPTFRVGSDGLQPLPVRFPIYESGPGPLQLMGKAAGSHNHDPVVAGEDINCFAQNLAQFPATLWRGDRVLQRIDPDRDHLHGPRLFWAPKEKFHWHL